MLRDREGSQPVVIVNETAARVFWPGQDPLGRQLVQQIGPDAFRSMTVVAVARDGKYRGLGDPPLPFLYVPLQQQQYSPRMTLVARTADNRRIAGELRRLVASMDSNLPIVTSQTLEDFTSLGLVPQRVAASVAGTLGAVGLLLAAMGMPRLDSPRASSPPSGQPGLPRSMRFGASRSYRLSVSRSRRDWRRDTDTRRPPRSRTT